jgi:torso-like protein
MYAQLFVALSVILFHCFENVEPASIGAIAQNIHSDLILLDANLASSLRNDNRDGRRLNIDKFGVPSGGAIDLFYRYGFFSLSVRVVPRDDPGSWLVREPTSRVFDDNSIRRTERPGPNSFAQNPVEISICDDVSELKEAYFRSFHAEGIAQPHKLYTGSWRTPTMAKYLGISIDVLDGDSSFVLIKLTKNSGTVDIDGRNLRLSSGAAQAAGEVRSEDEKSVLNFVENYGSHYIRSVTIGDAIYQVLALTKEQMDGLKAATRGVKRLSVNDWDRLYDNHLAPWKVRETGNIKVASGDVRLQRFAEEQLRVNAQFGSYANLVHGLTKKAANVQMLEELGRETTAVVAVDFASLKSYVGNGNIQAREYYTEIIDTHSALWEANL